MAETSEDLGLVGVNNPKPNYNPTGGVVQLPGQGGAPGAYTVDPGAAMANYLSSFSPELMDQLFKLEQEYGTRFQDMDIAARNRNINSLTALIGNLTNTAGNVARDETRTQSQFEVDRFGQFGGASIAAYIAGNPYLKSAMDRSDALGGVSTNAAYDALSKQLLGGAPSNIDLSPERIMAGQLGVGGRLTPQQVQAERVAAERIAAERIAAGQVQAGEVGAGALGQSLYQQALSNQQLSPLSQALQAQGLGMATAPGQLNPEELRAATQGARERFASSGRLEDNLGITGEALARAGASRERQMQDLAAAQGINAQLLGAQQAGQGLATDVLRADIARQQANVATGLQAGTFNVESALRAAQANQQTGLQASQANQDAFLRAALANQQTGLQASLANQQAGMQADQFNISNLQDVNRFNIQTGLDTSRFNADAANRFAEANRGFNYTAQQDYLRNLGLLGQSTQGLRESDRAYNLNQVNTYGNVSNAGLNATGYNTPAPGVAGGMNYFTAGSTVSPSQKFDPNTGVNLAATNAANLSNYNANIYSANKTLEAAEKTAAATKSAGKSSMFGSIAGAALTSGLAAKAGTAALAAL
jgi:hypothetical protein